MLILRESFVGCLEVRDLELEVVDLLLEAAFDLSVLSQVALLGGGELGASLLEFGLRRPETTKVVSASLCEGHKVSFNGNLETHGKLSLPRFELLREG